MWKSTSVLFFLFIEEGGNMIKALIINGVEFPVKYDGYTLSRNKIWSTNTGRNNAGNMVGTILAIKNKVEVELVPMTPQKAQILDNVLSDINNPFPTAKVLYLNGIEKEMTIYTGDVSYHWLSQAIGKDGLITGVKVSCIEK
jgi:transcription antitermination factor NusA-like protein